ncbi:hypothetical protein [Streptomyces sp. NPDC001100]
MGEPEVQATVRASELLAEHEVELLRRPLLEWAGPARCGDHGAETTTRTLRVIQRKPARTVSPYCGKRPSE